MRPAIVVHGIFDPAIRVAPLVRGLRARGVTRVLRARVPALGLASVEHLAGVLGEYVARTKTELGCEKVDVVGYSMGALVTRTYLQELAGHEHVNTFVSISGPHQGTLTAYALPLPGVRQMRPRSALLRRLGDDVSQLTSVQVHCLYTPFDAMIVPGESGVLRGARSVHRMSVWAHHLMLQDARVHDLVAAILHQENARSGQTPSRTSG